MANQYHPQNLYDQKSQIVLVMVPFPAQGHLIQLLHLSRLIISSSNDIPIYYVGSAIHNRQAKSRVYGWDPTTHERIHFHDFPIPSFESPAPKPNSSIPFPSHLQSSFNAYSSIREPFSEFIRELSIKARRVVVIHDGLVSSVAQDITTIPNGESYALQTVSAFWVYLYMWEAMGWPFDDAAADISPNDIPSFEGCFTDEFLNFINSQFTCTEFNSGSIYNTCRLLDGPYMDLLAKKKAGGSEKHWAIGPLNPVAICDTKKETSMRHKCLEWLDEQAPNSVIYVSFGTTTVFTDEQIQELAIGLEQSKQKFIWVLRYADKGDISEGAVRRMELPKGYEERVEGLGMVLRDWAPQLEILAHPSTGGFMSHCGWNSSMESISMGVPIAAWPMHSDQPRNTILITKILKIGLIVKDWANRDKLVSSTTIENAVRKLMASDEGNDTRKRATELGADIRHSMDTDGISRKELNSFINHICR